MYVTAMRRNMRNTSKQLLHCGLLLGLAEQARTRRTHEVLLIAGCSQFTRKNIAFCAPASPPTQQAPCNSHAAITMRFAATPTHPCGHYTMISIHSLQHLLLSLKLPYVIKSFAPPFMNVLLCDVKSHSLTPPFTMYCYVM